MRLPRRLVGFALWVLVALAGMLLAAAGIAVAQISPAPHPGAPAARADAHADVIAQVERYLDGIRSLEARFVQINPNGDVVSGTLYLQRPGRMRVEYDPPSKVLLIATDWRLIFFDGSIRQVNTIPLAQTPLAFLLADRIQLAGEVQVTAVREGPDSLDVEVVRASEANQGRLTLHFATQPFALRSWTVIDAQGLETRVVLSEMRLNPTLDLALFHWRDPQIFGRPED